MIGKMLLVLFIAIIATNVGFVMINLLSDAFHFEDDAIFDDDYDEEEEWDKWDEDDID